MSTKKTKEAPDGHWPKRGKPRGKPFAKGFDPRRRILTLADCRKGYLIATRVAKLSARCRAWLRNKLRKSKIAKLQAAQEKLWRDTFFGGDE